MIGMRYPYEVNLVGDAAATLRALIPLLEPQDRPVLARGHRAERRPLVGGRWTPRPTVAADPVNPMRLFRELSAAAARQRDRHRRLRLGGELVRPAAAVPRHACAASLSGNLATMGPGVPYAIGAKFGHPDRPAIAFAGDGAMQMNGLAELITIKRYWQEWADPRLVVAVLHNNDLNQVTWEMRAMDGVAEVRRVADAARRRLRRLRRAASACAAITVDDPDDVGAGVGRRRWPPTGRTVLDVARDPDVPPIPPHATFEQMKDAGEALLKGDDDRGTSSRRASRPRSRSSCPHGRADH